MKDVTSTSFGYVIAFLLPGLVCLYGLGFISPGLASLLSPALGTQPTITSGFVALLAGSLFGLLIAAARYIIFENWICRKMKHKSSLFKTLARDSHCFEFFKAAVDEHYRYHQFYGGFCLAFPILVACWLFTSHLPMLQLWTSLAGCAVVEGICGYAARDSFRKYVERTKEIEQV